MAKYLAVLFNAIEVEGEITKQCQLTTTKLVRMKDSKGIK